jgi:hypothetical protein
MRKDEDSAYIGPPDLEGTGGVKTD